MPIQVGPWPWSLLNVINVTVVAIGIFVAIQSARNVVSQNRGATIAWRIVVCFIGTFPLHINGVFFPPIGAAYIIVRHGPGVLRARKERGRGERDAIVA